MKERTLKTKLLTVLLTLCMVLSLTAFTAYAGELPKPDYLPEGVTYSNDYDHTYHTQVNVTANVSVKDSDGTVVETTQVSKSTEEFLKGGVGMLPMWMNFLLRTYSWMTILENNGLLNQLFQKIGLISLYNHIFGTNLEYFSMMNTQGAVVLGMVYNYLPFMILPIYSVIIKLDHSLLEAARDLGAGSLTVFRRVILPLSLPGVVSGITMVFVPSVSTFAISRMLGGGTELLLGDLIERQFLGGAYNPQLGAAISLVMMIIVLVCMLVMNRFGEGEEQAVKL